MKTILQQLRVKQWIKNLLIFAPLFFSFNLFNFKDISYTVFTFLIFSLAASFIYIINDISDKEKDKLHPRKKLRPIPSGKLSVRNAYIIATFLLFTSIGILLYLNIPYLISIIASYILLNISYAYFLKNISIIDCISISIGFELRIIAGCIAINVVPSDFILIVTFFLALMLAFIKRKGELNSLSEDSVNHRAVLKYYTNSLLDKFIFSSASITILGYLFYSIDDAVIAKVGNDYLKYSVVFVVYGILRFIQLTEIDIYKKEGDPTTLIYKDRPIQIALLSWIVFVAFCLYVK